ncbi:hypothetical protein GCM10007880_68070 [Mesorhizobium amorphae]|nr:hypothetical protein GCM10007880_68070 [Mesorhizobium amorphae]
MGNAAEFFSSNGLISVRSLMRQSIQRAVPNGDYSRLTPIGLISNG